jgi:hypothetical protein
MSPVLVQYFDSLPVVEPTHVASGCCSCPVCLGLAALERPRFFAGQLLTEADLTAAQDYVRAKSRLHNRYLHGSGVVCGLQVVCDECRGWISVKPGYAIDPCGEDIVVSEEQHIDVIREIRECRAGKRRREDCDPIRPDTSRECSEVPEHWCVTLAYEERETRLVNALRESVTAGAKCACGGGGGNGCSCASNGHGNGQSRSATAVSQARPECEPTRVHEGFRIALARSTEGACADSARRSLLEDSAIGAVLQCLRQVSSFVSKRMPSSSVNLLARMMLVTNEESDSPGDLRDQYKAYTAFRIAVRDLVVENPMAVRCADMDLWKDVYLDPPREGEEDTPFALRARPALYALFAMVFQYAIDCICMAMTPPCSPNPADDRITLACLEVKDDQIVQICNFPCRRQAGSFPGLYHWLPIPAVAAIILGTICCRPSLLRRRSPLVNDLLEFVDRADPSGRLREAVAESDFALPRRYAERAREVVARARRRVTPEGIGESVPSEGVNLATLVSQPVEAASGRLREAGATPVVRELGRDEEPPALGEVAAPALAGSGSTVIVYAREGRVVGYGRESAEVSALREELTRLRSEVDELRSARGS